MKVAVADLLRARTVNPVEQRRKDLRSGVFVAVPAEITKGFS
jgi:hypothetical protein